MTQRNNIKLMMEIASDWITRNGNRRSLITLTRADYSTDGKKLHIFYTVIPETQERPAEEFLVRHADDIQRYVKLKMKNQPPWFRFMLDTGERNRERITDLLHDTTETHGHVPENLK